LSLRTWRARLVRKGIRFSKDPRIHRIVVAQGNKLLGGDPQSMAKSNLKCESRRT
jgi:hypothetical protein